MGHILVYYACSAVKQMNFCGGKNILPRFYNDPVVSKCITRRIPSMQVIILLPSVKKEGDFIAFFLS